MSPAPDLESLRHIGWRGALPGAAVARVVAQHRAGYEVHDGQAVFAAQPAGHFLKRSLDPAARPAVGDFVHWVPGAVPEIVRVLPRRSTLVRAAAGERYAAQIIATNIDYVLVLTGLDGDFNPRRIERYLVLIEGSGAQPVVLLGKADGCLDVEARLGALRPHLPAGTPMHLVNSTDPACRQQLAGYLGPGDSAVLVGSSGAGKSTLTNTLLGHQRMATGAVRAADSRGRHTTTHRALLMLPSGGCLIDTPGMRELKLTGDEAMELFADIEALAGRCRFSDCSHGNEPGCAVRAALASGALDAGHWQSYCKLRGERQQQAAQREARRQRHGEGRRPATRGRKPRRDG